MSEENENTKTHVVFSSGTMVAHYRIINRIGGGGMGEVYLAEDTKLNRKVALKFLSYQHSQNEELKTRFMREAQASAKLSHQNIVHIYEVGEYQNRPFFAMEHIEGQSLRKYASENKLDVDDIIKLAIQICEGLQEAHSAGIVHRDIKPSNIVVDSKRRPRILDFGLATIVGTDQITKTGSTLGTVGYMSPEQIRGKTVDARSDLFSLGVILYELLADRRPFTGESEAEILNSIQTASPEPLARFKSDVSQDLQRIVSKLLEKEPDLRYQSSSGVVSDLKQLIVSDISKISAVRARNKSKVPLYGGIAVILIVVAIFFATKFLSDSAPVNDSGRKMLVVLPFENLGSTDDEYFADGITDEITSRLAAVSGLGVISRTSAIQYKETDKSLPQIATELGVDYVLEGTIRWDKSGDTDRVRITPQLINVSDNTHLWADNYERQLTQIFAVQEEIAKKVVQELNIVLLEPEKQVVQSIPTDNLEAYDLYLRAKEFLLSRIYDKSKFQSAISQLEKAIELDDEFVEAISILAIANVEMYWFHFDYSKERLQSARKFIDRAIGLDPNNQWTLLSEALYYYHGLGDYENALTKSEQLIEINPNNSLAYSLIAAVKRRQGKWAEAVKNYEKAYQLDPREAGLVGEFGITYMFLRNFPEAEKLLKRAISLAPEVNVNYEILAEMYLEWNADIERSRQFVLDNSAKMSSDVVQSLLAECDIYERNYKGALEKLSRVVFLSFDDTSAYYATKAMVFRLMGDSSNSKLVFDSCLTFLQNNEDKSKDNYFYKMKSAYVLAGLGRKQDAERLAAEAVQQMPISRDAIRGSGLKYFQALIYILVGEYDKAIDILEEVLALPGHLTINMVKNSPYFDEIRNLPRYKALIEKYDKQT